MTVQPINTFLIDPAGFIYRNIGVNSATFRLLDLFIGYDNKYTQIFPSQETISKALGVTRVWVNKCLGDLVDAGLLEYDYYHRQTCSYRLSSWFSYGYNRRRLVNFFKSLRGGIHNRKKAYSGTYEDWKAGKKARNEWESTYMFTEVKYHKKSNWKPFKRKSESSWKSIGDLGEESQGEDKKQYVRRELTWYDDPATRAERDARINRLLDASDQTAIIKSVIPFNKLDRSNHPIDYAFHRPDPSKEDPAVAAFLAGCK